MTLNELLNELNIMIEEEKDIFELFDINASYNIDVFPKSVANYEKYKQVEVFYQRVIDKEFNLHDFETIENSFIDTIKTLWLYDKVFAKILYDGKEIDSNYYYKKNRRLFRKHKRIINDIIADDKDLYFIRDIKVLKTLCQISTRDIAPILFVFYNAKMLLLLNGCQSKVLVFEKKQIQSLERIVSNNNLYIY